MDKTEIQSKPLIENLALYNHKNSPDLKNRQCLLITELSSKWKHIRASEISWQVEKQPNFW